MLNYITEADFHTNVRIVPGKMTDITLLQMSSSPPFASEVLFRQRFTQARSTSTAEYHRAETAPANPSRARGSSPFSVEETNHAAGSSIVAHEIHPEQDASGSNTKANQAQDDHGDEVDVSATQDACAGIAVCHSVSGPDRC